ncbi:MAG: protein translocase subunit SecF, partial [Candidatus Cloacimonadaceae bacterium]|nr:protein translocase subunit SecF [Candidatus Cloacimonadaceae bacterium]
MRLFRNTNIPFVQVRYVAYVISAILLIAGIFAFATKGLNWSIDFTSGVAAKVNLKAADPTVPRVRIAELRSVLKDKGFPEAEIQHIGEPENSSFMIKIKSKTDEADVSSATKDRILEILTEN